MSAYLNGIAVLSASASAEYAYERNAHGIFTKHLAKGLGDDRRIVDTSRDRQITARELHFYAAVRTTSEISSQHPQLQVGIDPVLLRY